MKNNCTNCGSVISCGCQIKTASNGTTVCSNCINAYEIKITEINPPTNTNE